MEQRGAGAMNDDETWVPAGVDTEHPSAARMYDYFLGGGHNFAADRQLADKVLEVIPAKDIARINRSFLRRAVRYLVNEAGILQFLDLGSGVPTVGNVHEVAQHENPDCTVVYVDNDPVAVAHGELMLQHNGNATTILADLRQPTTVLGHDETLRLIDFREPTAVLMCAALHFLGDEEGPADIVAAYRDALCPDSALVISHATDDDYPDDLARAVELYKDTKSPVTARTREQIVEFFAGFDLVSPGVVLLPLWRPDFREIADPRRSLCYGGVGIKTI
ncbi:SAM-dependent methyltransferase [Amycolatopsis nalaikhensis]|uniref:SAM-dependent methyltransferase n=1 Tax=Amycolatopsis nalaikhensis TaxID=715472 RepID=A0ABY8Y231_9PSEU|nr:SAM-dependent methyltransferase [Amycolatopsis sp. 2-2]WIV61918.1 SAM-dependent methyltransferase [Amycolatopsis sp. 2-2]